MMIGIAFRATAHAHVGKSDMLYKSEERAFMVNDKDGIASTLISQKEIKT